MLPLLLLLSQGPLDSGAAHNGRLNQLDVPIPRLEASAVIDGLLDDAVWRQAARLNGFSQYRPVDGRPAEDSTEILVWYAPDAIWFGVRAYETHGAVVRATLADRDNIGTDDNIRFLLDTYADRRRALLFAVNPLGVQQDGVWSDGVESTAGGPGAGFRFDATIDINPDYVFESKGRVTPWGYEVEIRIPFKSVRYQSVEPQSWGIQVLRTTQHSGYEDTWTPAVRATASFLSQSGRFTGLTGMRRGLVMDLTPEVTGRVSGQPQPPDYAYGHAKETVGGTLRWGITQNLSLAATINPDFSQVEADVGQVTLNERFALFFPEKRPFFLEGVEQYGTPNRLIYMRRIADPVVGVKLTGKVGGTNVGYLAAVDDDAQSLTGDHPVLNLLRVRRDLGATSTIGFTYTDRIDGRAYNRVAGADARVVWRKIWFSQAQLVGSWSRDSAGAPQAGYLWNLTMYDRTGRSYGNHGELIGITPDFDAQSGFVNRVNIVSGRLFNRFTLYGRPGARLEQGSLIFGYAPTWRYDDFFKAKSTLEGEFNVFLLGTLRGGWTLNGTMSNSHFRFDPPLYAGYEVDSAGTPLPFAVPHGVHNLWGGLAGVTSPNRAFAFNAEIGYRAVAIFDEAARGRAAAVSFGFTWRPTGALRTEASWIHLRLTRAAPAGTEDRFSTSNIPRVKVEYQLTRDIFFRYIGQYTAEDRVALEDPRTGRGLIVNGTPAAAQTLNDFRNDFLFSYKPTPGTVFFFGYGASLTEADPLKFRQLTRTGDGFFVKGSYLFRL